MSSDNPFIRRKKQTPAHSTLLDKSARYKRRAEQRETRKAMAATVQHDPRAVKFHF